MSRGNGFVRFKEGADGDGLTQQIGEPIQEWSVTTYFYSKWPFAYI